jgi:hypothetical protein
MILILALLYMGKNYPVVFLTSKASYNERILRLRSESNMQTWYIILPIMCIIHKMVRIALTYSTVIYTVPIVLSIAASKGGRSANKVPQIANPQLFVGFSDLLQMWYFADLRFADQVIFLLYTDLKLLQVRKCNFFF